MMMSHRPPPSAISAAWGMIGVVAFVVLAFGLF